MKLLLITASSPEIRKVRRSRFLNFQQITMPYLAALTPAHWQVEHIDEEVCPVDFNVQTDLVGITFHTPSAQHAYQNKKWWSSQASIHAGQDEEFLELARLSGCKQLFLGLESVSQASMNEVHKRFNRVEEYAGIIQRIHAHGIGVQAGVVFGFDSDTPAIFNDTTDFLEQNGIQNATFNILTPFPGTRLFQRLEAEGRILSYRWEKYNSRSDVVFRPKNMTCEQLLEGFQTVAHRFYSLDSIYRRLSRSPVGLWWTLPINLAYHISLRRFGFGVRA